MPISFAFAEGERCPLCLRPLTVLEAVALPCKERHIAHQSCVTTMQSSKLQGKYDAPICCPICSVDGRDVDTITINSEYLYRRAMLIWEAIGHKDNVDSFGRSGNYGDKHSINGGINNLENYQESIETLLHLLVRAAEEKHALAMFKLAYMCSEGIACERNLEEAELWLRTAVIQMRQEVQSEGSNQQDLLVAIGFHAVLLSDLGETEDAVPLFREALDGLRNILPSTHALTLGAIESLATALFDLHGGLDAEGEALRRESIRSFEESLGAQHECTMEATHKLACALLWNGRVNEAEPLLRSAKQICNAIFGSKHARTLAVIRNLANCIDRQGSNAFLAARDRSKSTNYLQAAASLWTEASMLFATIGGAEGHSSMQALQTKVAEATALAALVEAMPLRILEVLKAALATVQDYTRQRTRKMLIASEDNADLIIAQDSVFVRLSSPNGDGTAPLLSADSTSDRDENVIISHSDDSRNEYRNRLASALDRLPVNNDDFGMAILVDLIVEAQQIVNELEEGQVKAELQRTEELRAKIAEEAEKQLQEQTIAKFARRFSEQLKSKAMNTWMQWLEDMLATRSLCKRVFNRLLSIKMVCAFELWSLLSSTMKQEEEEEIARRRAREAEVAAMYAEEEAKRQKAEALAERERRGLQCANCGIARAPAENLYGESQGEAYMKEEQKKEKKKKKRCAALKPCGRCGKAFYCSRTCRITHWRNVHKKICMAPWDVSRSHSLSPVRLGSETKRETMRVTIAGATPSMISCYSANEKVTLNFDNSRPGSPSPTDAATENPIRKRRSRKSPGRWADATRDTLISNPAPG